MLKWTLVFPPTNRGFLEGLSIVLDNASSAFVSDTYIHIHRGRDVLAVKSVVIYKTYRLKTIQNWA